MIWNIEAEKKNEENLCDPFNGIEFLLISKTCGRYCAFEQTFVDCKLQKLQMLDSNVSEMDSNWIQKL